MERAARLRVVETIVKLRPAGHTQNHDVEFLARDGVTARVRVDGREVVTRVASAGGGAILTINERRFRIVVAERGTSILVGVGPHAFEFTPPAETPRRQARGLAAPDVTAPMPGKVLKLLV